MKMTLVNFRSNALSLVRQSLLATLAFGLGEMATAQSVPSLINYQGRLTDPSAAPLPTGNYGIEFRLWDSPSNTTGLVWGQRQNVSVQANGVFNVILGAPGGSQITNPVPAVNDLGFAFTSSSRFLGLTVVSSNGAAIATPSEILPRQQFLSAPYAMMSQQVVPGAIGPAQLSPGAVTAAAIAAGGIQTSNLADGLLTLRKLAPRGVSNNVPAGGIARSLPIVYQRLTASSFVDITNLTVTIETTGRPVVAFVAPLSPTNYASLSPAGIGNASDAGFYYIVQGGSSDGYFRLLRDGGEGVMVTRFGSRAGGSQSVSNPDAIGVVMDLPTVGTHTYKLQWGFVSGGGSQSTFYAELYNSVLIVFEL